jgi:23S rRNA pseudouridine955/2504/2580 synthase
MIAALQGKWKYRGMQEARKEAVTKVIIGEDAAGQRLDNYLFRRLKGVPKSRIYRMLREGEARVNGQRAQPSRRLEAGDEVRIPPLRTAEAASPPPARVTHSLLARVLYRDDALLALDKPAGQAVHGGSGVSLGIIEQLRLELPQTPYIELVHRLDKETSGVLVVALKRSALTAMHRMLREGQVRKSYLALAVGAWQGEARHVRLSLQKYVTAAGERRVAVDERGQAAHTVFSLIKRYPGYSLLAAELKTGRTHQIRVHLTALGHPIAGDDKYGDFELNRRLKKEGLKRMFLHAQRLAFAHPLTGAPLELVSPLPDDLQHFLDDLEHTGG